MSVFTSMNQMDAKKIGLESDSNEWDNWLSRDRSQPPQNSFRAAMNFVQYVVQVVKLIIRQRPKKYVRVAVVISGLSCLYLVYSFLKSQGLMYGNPYLSRWCEHEDIPEYMLKKEPDEITIITAYVNLGVVKKGHNFGTYNTPYNYRKWMQPLGRMTNPVIAFIEDDNDIAYFRQVRACLPPSHTKIIKFDRNDLWSFSLLEKIQDIFSKPNYPKMYPNTVNAEYVCLMHSKYELIKKVLDLDPFKTPAFAWMDISYFKKFADSGIDTFKLLPPEKFNPEKVGFTQAWPHDPNIDPSVIMRSNLVWASGGFVLGINETLQKFVEQYKWTVETLLNDGYANTDQQVLYAMFTTPMRHRYNKKQIKLKTYTCRQGQVGLQGQDVRHYCLGYVCKGIWEKIHQAGLAGKTKQ